MRILTKGKNMTRIRKFQGFIAVVLFSVGLSVGDVLPVDGTTGAPLGGIGTGGVKFCSYTGNFYGSFATPCQFNDFAQQQNMQFQLFTDRGGSIQTSQKLSSVITNGRSDDDAIYPVQYANLGITNGIAVTLTAFAPYDVTNYTRMFYPYVFYEIKLKNTQTTSVTAAIALQIQTSGNPTIVSGKGLHTGIDRALYASCGKTGATVSMGSDNGFFTTGICSNAISSATNRVAVSVALAAGDSALVRFVFSWFNSSTQDYWYSNAASNAAAFADTGLAFFDTFKTKAVELVTRMRASNLPGWLIDQTLNKLSNITNNSIYKKDGRYCHNEGEWGCYGTMDQMWHARQMNTMFVPFIAWQELHFWARTQKTDPVGQIHHDLQIPLCAWDDQQHADYRVIDSWVDLNCGFITSVYEAFIASVDTAQLNLIWPYVTKAAQRILAQASAYPATGYPYTFQGTANSYDDGGNPDPFNASMAITAFKAMTRLGAVENAPTLVAKYQGAFDTACVSFTKRYLSNNFPTGQMCESVLGGQWIGYYLKFGDYFPRQAMDYGLSSEDAYYSPLTKGILSSTRTYSEWGPYLMSHLGGLYLQTGKQANWRALQYDYAQRTFDDRNMVFNTYLDIPPKVTTLVYLATSASGSQQYMSLPVLWRNYYSIVGFQRNKYSGEMWIEPIIPLEMNHVMTNALIVTPEGYVTVSCTESGSKFQTRHLQVTADNPMAVSSIYLCDTFALNDSNIHVDINGVKKTFTRIGRDYSKELKVDWNGTLGPAGIVIDVADDSTRTMEKTVLRPSAIVPNASITCQNGKVLVSTRTIGAYRIDVTSLDGKVVKSIEGAGARTYTLDGFLFGAGTRSLSCVYLITVRQGGRKTVGRVVIYK